MGATLAADTSSIPTGYDTSNPVGLLAVARTAPAIRPEWKLRPATARRDQNSGTSRTPATATLAITYSGEGIMSGLDSLPEWSARDG